VPGIDGLEHAGRGGDLDGTEHGQRREPQHHDGTEQSPDARRATALNREQRHDDADGHGQYRAFELRIEYRETFDRAQHRDGRRDQRITIKQRGAEYAERDRAARPGFERTESLLHQRHEREDAALAVVVGTHDHREVLDRHDDGETPEDERQQAEHGGFVAGLKSRGGQ
jgi:hypothetical protein